MTMRTVRPSTRALARPATAAFVLAATALALAGALARPAQAAEVFKCPTADGRVEFRDRPCDGKPGEKIAVKPAAGEAPPAPPPGAARSAAQLSAAEKQAAGEASIRNTIRKQDEERERRAKDQQLARARCNGVAPNQWYINQQLSRNDESSRAAARFEIERNKAALKAAGC